VKAAAAQTGREWPSAGRSPLEQLLHGLNQPLTGLQCSMEVALASPRTVDYYAQRLREGLELTERMRALVNAIREVVDGERERNEINKDGAYAVDTETVELQAVLRAVVDELKPVAEVKRVHMMLQGDAGACAWVKGGQQKVSILIFRMLESALSQAARGSALRIESGDGEKIGAEGAWLCIRWRAGERGAELSPPELGLLVAQAGWTQAGAQWLREKTDAGEAVTVRMLPVSGDRTF
jgi:signal transduction histidine kinase